LAVSAAPVRLVLAASELAVLAAPVRLARAALELAVRAARVPQMRAALEASAARVERAVRTVAPVKGPVVPVAIAYVMARLRPV
jgi:hypothetical protein